MARYKFFAEAAERKWNIAGALNNDMIGWAGDNRMDNTIRYSNPGIRDIQHGADDWRGGGWLGRERRFPAEFASLVTTLTRCAPDRLNPA